MYERAEYFKNRFIRNGIAGFAISAFFMYNAFSNEKTFQPIAFIFPVVAFVWLCLGLWINKKLKTKDAIKDSNEITDERISFQYIELILTVLLVLSLFLNIRHYEYANYLMISIVIAYTYWLYTQVKLLSKYFKE